MARVLLVDDEASVRFALKELVQARGWEPLVARSAAEALELVERADAVVTDFLMPEMDGMELVAPSASATRARRGSRPGRVRC
jgi:CheY-like chemotaxis protein